MSGCDADCLTHHAMQDHSGSNSVAAVVTTHWVASVGGEELDNPHSWVRCVYTVPSVQ